MRYTRSPSVFSDSSLSASFLRTTAAKNPRTVCGCQPVEVMIAAIVAPLGRRSSPSTRACFEFARLLRSPLRAAFGRTLDGACALAARPRLRWDIQNSSPLCRRNIAPPPPEPRGGPRALAGERSEAIRLAVRDHHTRSLGAESPAQSEQWCCWFGRRRIISGSAENRGSSRPSAIDRPPAQASPLRSYIRPELRFPHAAAQTRIVSVARIRLDSRKSVRPFKGIFCDDISEFESHMPSQPVRSLCARPERSAFESSHASQAVPSLRGNSGSRENSAAISATRSGRASAHRTSIATLRPSIQPSSRSRCTNAATPLALDRRRARTQEPDHRKFGGLLRARRNRPRGRSAAKKRDELAPLHSITSSASASSVGGRSSPSALAVLRLIT